MPHLEICMLMIGDGMLMIPLKVVIGLEIKMLFTICVNKLHKLSLNLNLMECLFQEQNKEKFIKELLEDNQKKEENVINIMIFRTSL